MLSEKYENLLKMKEPPEEMSIMELGVLGKELGIDTDAISDKHFDALFEELFKEVREAYKRRANYKRTQKGGKQDGR